MTQIEQIRAEIERRLHNIESCPFIEAEFGAEMRRDGEVKAIKDVLAFIDSLPAETASPELEKAAEEYARASMVIADAEKYKGFIAGAEWQKQQFEKNRLAACTAQTKEEYDRETELVDKIVIGEHRMPTFSDAINYGINWQKQQMAGQGVTIEAKFIKSRLRGHISLRVFFKDGEQFNNGEDVIVQVRKK